jgi:hypothetical protein
MISEHALDLLMQELKISDDAQKVIKFIRLRWPTLSRQKNRLK